MQGQTWFGPFFIGQYEGTDFSELMAMEGNLAEEERKCNDQMYFVKMKLDDEEFNTPALENAKASKFQKSSSKTKYWG